MHRCVDADTFWLIFDQKIHKKFLFLIKWYIECTFVVYRNQNLLSRNHQNHNWAKIVSNFCQKASEKVSAAKNVLIHFSLKIYLCADTNTFWKYLIPTYTVSNTKGLEKCRQMNLQYNPLVISRNFCFSNIPWNQFLEGKQL